MHRLTLLFKILKIFRTVGPPADRSITKAVVDAVAVAAEPEMPFGVFANVRGAAPSLKAVQSQMAVQVHWQLLHKQARWHTHARTYMYTYAHLHIHRPMSMLGRDFGLESLEIHKIRPKINGPRNPNPYPEILFRLRPSMGVEKSGH